MDASHGGRATLRLGAVSETEVEYSGELELDDVRFPSTLHVARADGAVRIAVEGSPPTWLVEIARTTLRAAWRATLTGTEWPRRVSRWRPAKATDPD